MNQQDEIKDMRSLLTKICKIVVFRTIMGKNILSPPLHRRRSITGRIRWPPVPGSANPSDATVIKTASAHQFNNFGSF